MQQTRGMSRARMAELVDAPASGAGAGNGVEVRVLFRAPSTFKYLIWLKVVDFPRVCSGWLLHL